MAAPTVVMTVHQASTTRAYQPVLFTLGMSREEVTLASEWTQSTANTNEYYYTGGTAGLSSNTMYRVRAQQQGIKYRSGTLGSLDTYGYGFGDNDSLGYDTIYVRMGDNGAPADYEMIVNWDESQRGDTNRDADCTVEHWWDLTDSNTATAIAAWDAAHRYITDPRTGETIDLAGRDPDDGDASPLQGWAIMQCLPPMTSGKLKTRVTNGDGDQTTITTTVTVSDTARTEHTVHATETADYTTIAAAYAAASANDQVTILDGHTETVSAGLQMTKAGLYLKCEGSCTITQSSNARVFRCQAEHMTLEGFTFETSVANSNGAITQWNGGNCAAVVNCNLSPNGTTTNNFDGLIDYKLFNVTTTQIGTLMQGCTLSIFDGYSVAGQTNRAGHVDLIYVGNDILGDTNISATSVPSVSESAIRDAFSVECITVLFNSIRELTKDGLRSTHAGHYYIYGNYFIDGSIRVGESGFAGHKAYETRIDSNYIRRTANTSGLASIDFYKGADGVTVVNNIFSAEYALIVIGGATNPGNDTTYYAGYREHRDLNVCHNTIAITTGNEEAFFGSTGTYVTDCTFQGNQVLTHASYSGTEITANAFTASSNDTATGSLTNLIPSEFGTSETTRVGAFYDFFGMARGASSSRGAYAAATAAPTVVNRTPADDATGVSEAQTISLEFSEDMQIDNGSASIELRQASDDSVLDSITAGDATINISDKTQVTLTGLSLSGVSGAVYVYIPADAFASRTTAINFAGYTANTDWNFSVGAVASGGNRSRTRTGERLR